MKSVQIVLGLLLYSLCGGIFGQDLPTIPSSGFSFPLGSKFTIKLYAIDSMSFEYSIIEFEPYEEIIDSWGNDNLFPEEGQDSTLSFYFTLGTRGETEEEREKNMKIFLVIKNYTDIPLEYESDIQREEDEEYESTSNVGVYSNAISREMWPYYIHFIGIRDLKRMTE